MHTIKLDFQSLDVCLYLPQKGKDIMQGNLFWFSLLLVSIISGSSLCLNRKYIWKKVMWCWQIYQGPWWRNTEFAAGWVANNSIASPLCKGDFWLLSYAGLLGSKIIPLSLIVSSDIRFISYYSKPPSHYVVMHNDFAFMQQKEAE